MKPVNTHKTLWNSIVSLRSKLKTLRTQDQKSQFLDGLNPYEKEELSRTWWVWAHTPQIPPSGSWRTWLMMGGRGAGKTRAGAEWLKSIVDADNYTIGDGGGRIALIGETYQDVRSVMIEGESGLLAVHRKDKRPKWTASRRLLEWPNGTIGQIFSANDPDGLRGSQFGAAWCDAKTIWGSLVAIAAALSTALGLSVDHATQAELTSVLVQITGAAGSLLAIYGRLIATDVIS